MKKVENHWLTHLTSIFLNLWGYLYANGNMSLWLAEFICTSWTFPPESSSHPSAVSRVERIQVVQSWLGQVAVEGHSCPTEKLSARLCIGENGSRTIAVNCLASVNIDVCRKVFQPFFLIFQEVLVALSSTNYKFPNPRHLGASLKQGLFMLRLVVNCNSLESGRFVSQSSSRDCSCQWHLFRMLLPSALSYFKMGNSFHRLPKGLAGGVTGRTQNSLACRL